MANNYLQFSEMIENLTPDEKEWVQMTLFHELGEVGNEKADEAFLDALGLGTPTGMDDPEGWPDFNWDIVDRDGVHLWIYAEESGDIDHVGAFVRSFLAKFRPKEVFKLTWSETCSKLRVGEFGGGALFVTAEEYDCLQTWLWFKEKQKKFDESGSK